VDAYPPKTSLIDITMEMAIDDFNKSQVAFATMLRGVLQPWHAKIKTFKLYKNK
jgi:hypothetical protein